MSKTQQGKCFTCDKWCDPNCNHCEDCIRELVGNLSPDELREYLINIIVRSLIETGKYPDGRASTNPDIKLRGDRNDE